MFALCLKMVKGLRRNFMFLSVTEELLSGLGISVEIFILTLIFSLPLGLIIAFGSMSRFKP